MNPNLLNDLERDLKDLRGSLVELELLEKYYSQVPEEWKADIQKMIKTKESILRLLQTIDKIKLI